MSEVFFCIASSIQTSEVQKVTKRQLIQRILTNRNIRQTNAEGFEMQHQISNQRQTREEADISVVDQIQLQPDSMRIIEEEVDL